MALLLAIGSKMQPFANMKYLFRCLSCFCSFVHVCVCVHKNKFQKTPISYYNITHMLWRYPTVFVAAEGSTGKTIFTTISTTSTTPINIERPVNSKLNYWIIIPSLSTMVVMVIIVIICTVVTVCRRNRQLKSEYRKKQ